MPAPDSSHAQTPAFIEHLTGCQSGLYAFIATLLGGDGDAADVLQETNLVLWNKAADYDPRQPFLPWAYTFARFQVMAWRKKQSRSRLLLDDALVARVAEEMTLQEAASDRQLRALEFCLDKLRPGQRQLVDSRYADGVAVNQIAALTGRSENMVSASLYRIRKLLTDCVRTTLAMEEPA